MPARRRRAAFRTPSQRAEMWKQKMDGQTYARILERTKPLALPRVAEYQAEHEHLISIVKAVLEPLALAHQAHQYVWYAQEIYKAVKRYSGEALRNEVNAIYMKYFIKGLNDAALFNVASTMGVKPDPAVEILRRKGIIIAKIIIGFGEAGFIVYAGQAVQHQPFSGARGASKGMALPIGGKATNLKVYILENTLNGPTYVYCRRNEGEAYIGVEIPPGESGLFSNDEDSLFFNENDRIDFLVDATRSSDGEIDVVSAVVVFSP